jgi:hypothetical protein
LGSWVRSQLAWTARSAMRGERAIFMPPPILRARLLLLSIAALGWERRY